MHLHLLPPHQPAHLLPIPSSAPQWLHLPFSHCYLPSFSFSSPFCPCLPCSEPFAAFLCFFSVCFGQLSLCNSLFFPPSCLLISPLHLVSILRLNVLVSFPFRRGVRSLLYHHVHHAHECPVDVRVHSKRAQWVTTPISSSFRLNNSRCLLEVVQINSGDIIFMVKTCCFLIRLRSETIWI